MARKRRVSTPPDVVRHSPLPFDDSSDSFSSTESVSSLEGVPSLPALAVIPRLRPLNVLPKRSLVAGVWGGTPHAKSYVPSLRRLQRSVISSADVSSRFLKAKGAYDRRRRLFNRVDVPFSGRAVVCVKRRQKREMVFATGKGGRNGFKRYRKTWLSSYSC